MNISEKYCLKWNEFSLYICDSFKELRDDNDFFDVTLACDDGKQIKANKVVLSSCSPVLKTLLKSNPHSHPLVVLRGYTSHYLKQLIDFMYFGEVNVAQQDFNEFLRGAKDLQVKGLSEEKPYHQKESKHPKPVKNDKIKDPSPPPVKSEKTSPKKILEVVKTKVSINPVMIDDKPSLPPPQVNVTFTAIDNNDNQQDNTPLTVKKQEEEEENKPECFDVSDSEEPETVKDSPVENYQTAPDSKMVVDSRPVVETVLAVVKKVAVDTKQATAVTIPAVTRQAVHVQSVNFAAAQTYTQVPQKVFTQVQNFASPPAHSPASATHLQQQTRTKKIVVETSQQVREKEDDPILKMFSMRSAGGWTCTSCGQFSNQKNAMKVHIQTNHMSGFGHVCDECGKSFRTRGRLLSHIDQTHAGT